MVTINSAENALKSVYLGAVTELLNTKVNPLMTKIEQTSADVWGKEIRKAVSAGVNGGIGAGDEAGALPAAHGNHYLQYVTTLKNLYGQIEISDKAIRASANDKGAFTDLLNAEIDGLLKSSKFNLGRMLYGDGSGLLASVMRVIGGKLVVKDYRNLIEGLTVDIYNGDTLVVAGAHITDIDYGTAQISLDKSLDGVEADFELYVQGSRGKEITGLGAIFDTTKPLYGIDRTNVGALKPVIKKNAGALDEVTIQTVIDKLETQTSSNVDFIAVSEDVRYAYMEYMSQFKRNIDMMMLDGGFKSMSFNGIPFVYDRFVPSGTMYLLDTSAFRIHQLCDWRFLETENGNILRQNQGYPVYTATLVKYCDLICDRPNGQAMITGIVR